MGRNARFSSDRILTAALELLAERGPEGVTMSAISRQTGAPIGSIYHRFPSRDLILALLWLDVVESFQDGFLETLASGGRPCGRALYAALGQRTFQRGAGPAPLQEGGADRGTVARRAEGTGSGAAAGAERGRPRLC